MLTFYIGTIDVITVSCELLLTRIMLFLAHMSSSSMRNIKIVSKCE
jgi:hypothetical protein